MTAVKASTNVAEAFDTLDYGLSPESDKQAKDWLKSHKDGRMKLFIGGTFVAPSEDAYFDVTNPANGDHLIQAAQGSAADVDKAVKAARKAQKSWAAAKGFERARVLYALARLLQKHARLFAVLETLDNGKTIRETRDIDVPLAVRHFYHHAGWAQIAEREYPDYEPYGVAGQIIPWNFPLLMLAWKIAPALALGNTVVLKPAEQTPLTAILFAEICREAGVPDGVVNIVTGDGRTGAALVAHDGIDKLAFTGSTEIGRLIRKNSAGSGKTLTLELGGKSPFIVFEDADLDSAVEGVVDAIWFNQGEVCCGGSRLLLQESIAERFIGKLLRRMETLRVGDPLDKCMDMGSVVDEAQLTRISGLVDAAVKAGACLHQPCGSAADFKKLGNGKGCFYPPTLLTDVEPSDDIAQTEVFGPVLAAMTFKNQDEAVSIANNTVYGLAASVWSENINMALEMAPRLKAGVVWVNATNQFDAAAGFGGYRESGYGREGGREGLFAYMRPKYEGKLSALKAPKEKPVAIAAPAVAAKGTDSLIDRTAKNYIGGKQQRPDGNYSLPVLGANGQLLGHVGEGNRKDVRNAVEAALKGAGWAATDAHLRSQIMYYLGENLAVRKDDFMGLLRSLTGTSKAAAEKEFTATLERVFYYAGWCDKYEGSVHTPPQQSVVLAMNEPLGIVGMACPEDAPLLSLMSLILPAMATGNCAVVLPSESAPLLATELYQVFDTSDLPGGVVNIVTGRQSELVKTLAEHDGVDSMWYFGHGGLSKQVEEMTIGNLKQSWVNHGKARDWYSPEQGEGREFLRRATQVKNIWVPYGESFAAAGGY